MFEKEIQEARHTLQAIYDQLTVPGVRPEHIPLLFNTSNYRYYCEQVLQLTTGVCNFCAIDVAKNEVIMENDSWLAIRNRIAPRGGQLTQIVVPLKRHIEDSIDLTDKETLDQQRMYRCLRMLFGVSCSARSIRDGDVFFNAKSMLHFHWNFHLPSGVGKVEVTFGKEPKKIEKKLPKLRIFEKMRFWAMTGVLDPWSRLSPEEFELIKEDIEPPKTVG